MLYENYKTKCKTSSSQYKWKCFYSFTYETGVSNKLETQELSNMMKVKQKDIFFHLYFFSCSLKHINLQVWTFFLEKFERRFTFINIHIYTYIYAACNSARNRSSITVFMKFLVVLMNRRLLRITQK